MNLVTKQMNLIIDQYRYYPSFQLILNKYCLISYINILLGNKFYNKGLIFQKVTQPPIAKVKLRGQASKIFENLNLTLGMVPSPDS